jgi:hypothetical protein
MSDHALGIDLEYYSSSRQFKALPANYVCLLIILYHINVEPDILIWYNNTSSVTDVDAA